MTKTYFVENNWACSSCAGLNKGRDINCIYCGNAKEDHEKDSMPVGDPRRHEVKDPSLIDLATQAPHWTCEFCGGKQRDPDGNCVNCAAARSPNVVITASGGSTVKNIVVEGVEFSKRKSKPKRSEFDSKHHVHDESELQPAQGLKDIRKELLIGALLLVAFVLIISGIYWAVKAHEVLGTVSSMKWIHMVRDEERMTYSGEGWSIPIGAFNTSCVTKQRGTHNCRPYQCNARQESYNCNPRQCNCTTKTRCADQKNGFSKCTESTSCQTCYSRCTKTVYSTCYEQCPTMDQWCSYQYHKWISRGERTKDGTSADAMDWPLPGIIDETHRSIKVPAYIVHFDVEGEKFSYSPSTAEDFARFETKQIWVCERRFIGMFKPLRLEAKQ